MVKIIQKTINDKDFYQDLGRLITGRKTIKELGEPVITSDIQTWFVAYDKNNVVGFSSSYRKGDEVCIGYLYVIEDYRNKGIGEKLLKKQIELAVSEKAKSISVVASILSCRLFDKFKFVVTHEYVNYKKMRLEL